MSLKRNNIFWGKTKNITQRGKMPRNIKQNATYGVRKKGYCPNKKFTFKRETGAGAAYNPAHGINKKLKGYTLKAYAKIQLLDGGFEVMTGSSEKLLSPRDFVLGREPQLAKKTKGGADVVGIVFLEEEEDADNV